ncbi:RNA polymerase II-associated protein 1-like protein [Yarrowia sp. C11]|nr:RNA polymerase II-associated protein 1-like protein [Yarrowia sp. C11]KAG5370524.1 RNA polymerase II-associated protein 1-like protein [Yarrowia sp. E02]
MSRRQDYLVRVRYQNELPPPELPPKMLNIPVPPEKLTSLGINILSDMQRRESPQINVDNDLGMPLDLTEIRGVFEQDDESGLLPLETLPELDPRDLVLLKEPQSTGNKSQPGVAFLRRTEYISSEVSGGRKLETLSASQRRLAQKTLDDSFQDPESQLRAVEATFEAANSDIKTLKHPKKPHLTAVESFPILPNSQIFDLTFLTMKMVGSAVGVPPLADGSPDPKMSVSLFRPMTLETDEWMSMFLAKDDESKDLKRQLDSTDEHVADDKHVYRFEHKRDYDMDLQMNASQFEEIVIDVDLDKPGSVAHYVPVQGKTNLKRRRVLKSLRSQIKEHNIAAIDLTLRDITAEESIIRDNTRAEYDPVSYMVMDLPASDEEEDEEEE